MTYEIVRVAELEAISIATAVFAHHALDLRFALRDIDDEEAEAMRPPNG